MLISVSCSVILAVLFLPQIDPHSGNHGQEESINFTNKSKSANESWYEYKERCSATSLTDHLQQREPQKPLSPFYLRGNVFTLYSEPKDFKSQGFSSLIVIFIFSQIT